MLNKNELHNAPRTHLKYITYKKSYLLNPQEMIFFPNRKCP